MEITHLETHSVAWFNNVFTDSNVPSSIRTLSERICRSYNITGICDPVYIANIIALELGMGDGKGYFTVGDKYHIVCLDCGKSVSEVNADGECAACVMETERLRPAVAEHKAPKAVRSSACGCRNCLWASAECSFGSKYVEAETVKLGEKTVETCGGYTYYN